MFDLSFYEKRCCVCCGQNPEFIIKTSDPKDDQFLLHCKKCGKSTMSYLEPEDAVAAWNVGKYINYQEKLF